MDNPTESTADSSAVSTGDQEWGSDFIADFLVEAGFDYAAFTPGSSFRGIGESVVNYRRNTPTVIEVPHEALSVSIAHGYAKATHEPGLCFLHDVVGTLHGSMMLFNAYCDRVPLLAIAGAGPTRKTDRRPFFDWIHTTINQGNLVRGYTKWDDQPVQLEDLADSLLRALKITKTPPYGPTYVAIDHELQERRLSDPIPLPTFEKFKQGAKPGPDPAAIDQAADMLVDADLPVIIVDSVGDSREAVDGLVSLAETLGAAVIHSHRVGTPHRYNFPNTHPLDLAGTDVVQNADVVLALDAWDVNYTLREVDQITHEQTELVDDFTFIDVGLRDLRVAGIAGDEFGLRETDLAITADTALAIPALDRAISDRFDRAPPRVARRDDRTASLGEIHAEQRAAWESHAEDVWDESPVSLPRLASELWELIRDDHWVSVNGTLRGWIYKLWEIDDFDQYIGGYSGGGGIGHGVGHAIGGALAFAESERIPINLQPDGDLMFYPGGLWTIAHYNLPMLSVVHNNQSLYNSTQHRMRLAEYRDRDSTYEQALVGTGLQGPVPDYAAMAESMGVRGFGPVRDPSDLSAALASAWRVVKGGDPALVDVICQPR